MPPPCVKCITGDTTSQSDPGCALGDTRLADDNQGVASSPDEQGRWAVGASTLSVGRIADPWNILILDAGLLSRQPVDVVPVLHSDSERLRSLVGRRRNRIGTDGLNLAREVRRDAGRD